MVDEGKHATGPLTNGFTMPGEAGCAARVLELARLWGADALRDSDGTELPEQIRDAGYPIYGTVCLIRGDNAFAKANRDKLIQTFLMSREVLTEAETVSIELLEGFPRDVYVVNDAPESLAYWQVFDRTAGEEVPRAHWSYAAATGCVTVAGTRPWRRYTVNFLASEIWESINRYNHRVNHWTSEPQLPMNVAYPEVRGRMRANLAAWLDRNPHTSIVRFTSFYYSGGRGGWADYGRTVSLPLLAAFEKQYGYRQVSETFVNGGAYNSAHRPPSRAYRDWMAFVHDFFIETTRPFVEMVRARGKKVFALLGDQWVGSEPLAGRFGELGVDGVVKSAFNGFEARILGAVESAPIRELRLHPYFFPKEVTGKPTFCAEGDPTGDLQTYWTDIRRACLRVRIDRIGFGGYVSLLDPFPEFVAYVAEVSRQARAIRALHGSGAPYTGPVHVAVLNCWGASRAWMCAGHMTHNNGYNQFLESLAGLPVRVSFLSFQDVLARGIPADVNVLANAGREGTSWSGGDAWRDPALVERVMEFVARGGGFLGIGEPSACRHGNRWFQLAPLLGVEREPLLQEGGYDYAAQQENGHFLTRDLAGDLQFVNDLPNLCLSSPEARVVAARQAGQSAHVHRQLQPQVVVHPFRAGRSVYFSGFRYSTTNTRLLHRALFWAARQEEAMAAWMCDNPACESAWFPGAQALAVANNSRQTQAAAIRRPDGSVLRVDLPPLGLKIEKA